VIMSVITGLASHQPCVSDLVDYPPKNLTQKWPKDEDEHHAYALEGHGTLYLFYLQKYGPHFHSQFTQILLICKLVSDRTLNSQ